MDKHGPMEINDDRLFGQLAILPENSQMLIQNCGGLEKFLLSSTAFVNHEGLICLAEYAAVVAASMNSGSTVDDTSLGSNNLRGDSREMELQEGNNASGLKQKGFSKINKDLGKPSSTINGVANPKALYTSNKSEAGIKKNSAMSQQASKRGFHTPTPPPGFTNNPPLGKPPYPNKSTHIHSNNSNTSNYGSNSVEGSSKKTSTNIKCYNGKESFSSVSSGLDAIDNSLTFSNTKKSSGGLFNSTSTEHSQEGPNGEDDGLIGNLFDYNAFGTGSSSNYLSPSNDGYFPNAYPQEQMDSTGLLSHISLSTADTSVTNKAGVNKKSNSSMLESAISASNIMNPADSMKLLTSGVDLKTTKYGVNASTSSTNTSIPYSSGGHHMEPVYLPPPPPIQRATVNKKDTCIETDFVYVYCENYKEKYETAMKSQDEVLRRLQESEDRRVQMSKTHAVELELAVRRAKENTKMVNHISCFIIMCVIQFRY